MNLRPSYLEIATGLPFEAPKGQVRLNLNRLRDEILLPIEELLGTSLIVLNAFHGEHLAAVLGTSQVDPHREGREADVIPVGVDLHEAFDAIRRSNLPFEVVTLVANLWLSISFPPAGCDPARRAYLSDISPDNRRWHSRVEDL